MEARLARDKAAHGAMLLCTAGVVSLVVLIAVCLLWRALPVLRITGLGEILLGSGWRPAAGEFGLAAFIIGTGWVTGIAMLIAVPLSLLTAAYLAEYASSRARRLMMPIIDLLAGISPVIYGVWGVLVIVPFVRDWVMPILARLPLALFQSDNYTGFSAVSGGIVLAVMVSPFMVAVAYEVMRAVPHQMREAAQALGATRWETVKLVVLEQARPGIIAAVILALSRALGETMAVLMVAGCSLHMLPKSIFDPAYPLPALIANTYGEMMSIPLYDAAVLFAAFVLLIVTMLCNAVGWTMLLRAEARRA